MNWHTFGILLSLLAAASLALGVADVVVTYKTYMEGKDCNTYVTPNFCDPNILVWTWVAVGIWGSLPVFIFGVLSIYKGSRPMQQVNFFDLFAFISTFIFSPAIVVLSSIEVYKGRGAYYWPAATELGQDDLIKAIIPIVIAGLGFIEFLMSLIAFFSLCCNPTTAATTGQVYGGGFMDKTIIQSSKASNQYNGYPQATYDRAYNTQPANQGFRASGGGQSSSFYAAQAPPRCASTYNQFNTGPMQCNRQCAPNPAYNYFRS